MRIQFAQSMLLTRDHQQAPLTNQKFQKTTDFD